MTPVSGRRAEAASPAVRFVPPYPPRGTGPVPVWRGLFGERARTAVYGWSEAAFRLPYMRRKVLGYTVHIPLDPDLVQQVLLDKAAAYAKPDIVKGLLAPVIGRGLLTSDGAAWREQRSAELVACAASDVEGELEFEEVQDSSPHAHALSAVRGASVKHRGFRRRTRSVPARPLTAVLSDRSIEHVDFMSIDVEGHELNVLRGLDFSRIAVDVILVENNVPPLWGEDVVRQHMRQSGFVHYARIWHFDDVFLRAGFSVP